MALSVTVLLLAFARHVSVGDHCRGRLARGIRPSQTGDYAAARACNAGQSQPQGGGDARKTRRGASGGYHAGTGDGGWRAGGSVHARTARAGFRGAARLRAALPTMSPASRGTAFVGARWSPRSTSTRRTPTTSSGSGSRTAGRTAAPAASSLAPARTAARAGRPVTTLKTTLCTGGTAANGGGYQRATDPWVSFGPTGIVYQLSLSFNDVAPPFTTFDFDHALLASRSTNGGLTWSDPVVVKRDTAPTVFNDKQSITADPTNPSYVYAVWDRLVFPGSERASVVASFRTNSFNGPAWFARSTRRRSDLGAGASDLGSGPAGSDDRQPDRRPAERNPGRHLHRVQQREREEAPGRVRARAALDRQGRDMVRPVRHRKARDDRCHRSRDGR